MNSPFEKEFFTTQELAELLQLKVATIYKYVREDKLPTYKFGKALRFRNSDVEAFLQQHKVSGVNVQDEENDED